MKIELIFLILFFLFSCKDKKKTYYENGLINEEFKVSNGRKNGEARKYFPTGELNIIANFENDEILNSKSFDKNGIIYNEVTNYNQEIIYLYRLKDTSLYEMSYIKGNHDSLNFDSSFFFLDDSMVLSVFLNEEGIVVKQRNLINNISIDSLNALKKTLLSELDDKDFYRFKL
ncbi:MAG: hypothetical protein AAF363_20080 [Bacteroidota bacterium]